ncbi:MAG: SpoIIE family protein phosphatase [Anaerolineales bacterium]|nr:SpoIIE family protein phosphatase [Anaerolineales bacterium]
MHVNLLSKIPLFADLPKEELDQIIETLDVKEMKDREILFREGSLGEHFYIVTQGELEVLMAAGQMEELQLNVMRAGEHFGEMSLIMPGGQRTATVRARGDATLLAMSRAQFLALTKKHPELSSSMVKVLSQRLDATNTQTFRDLTEKNKQLQTAYDELKAAQAQLIEKERLERELQVAAEIQLSILPDELPEMVGFSFGARILPARQVGGDLYDVFPLKDDKVGVLIGDVADKGIPSAIFMARAHALVMAEADMGMTAGEVLHVVNRHITRLQKSTQFVTVLYGILDLQTREFHYARAGHEPPLILHADGTVERLPHSPGMALGLWDSISLDERTVTLPPGSTLLLFTDGLTDCRDSLGEPFGLERIKKTFSELSNATAQQVCDHMLKTLVEYQDGSKQDDDVTLVAIHAVNK